MPSPIAPPDLTPQPGAVFSAEGFVPNGLPFEDHVPNVLHHEDVNYKDWPTLPAAEAVNFVSAEPFELKILTDLTPSRIWGDPAWDLGCYWSEAPANDKNHFYGDFSVKYSWNSAQYQGLLQALPTGVTSIKAWRGPTARQPAELLDESGRSTEKNSPDHQLPGGGIQYYIPKGTFPYIHNSTTPWRLLAIQATAIAPTLIAPLPAQQLPAEVEPATYGKLLEALGRLATLLRQIEANAGGNNPLLGRTEGFLSRSAERLAQAGEQLNQHLASAATNADAKAQATLTLWSLVATGRHVDGDFSFSGQQGAVDQAINDVVAAAYALAKGTSDQEA